MTEQTFATGGPVLPGAPVLVGERGSETVIPTRAGTVGSGPTRPPRTDLYRAMLGGAAVTDGKTLTVRLAPAGEWAEINSVVEGRFMERFSRSAYTKTMDERLPKIQFQHGKDPQVGDKVIATTDAVGEDDISPFARGTILDGVPELVVAGLRAGVYGTSHRFDVVREDWNEHPKGGPHNPSGLPERTITEARLYEMGPVTWPAYAGASASLRSLTDEMRATNPPVTEPEAPSLDAEAETPHLEPERRDEPVVVAAIQPEEKQKVENQYMTRDEKVARVDEIGRELKTLDAQFDGVLPDEPQTRWNAYVGERTTLLADIDAYDARQRDLGAAVARGIADQKVGSQTQYPAVNVVKTRDLSSIYDVQRTMREAHSAEAANQALHDNAMRAIEGATFKISERAKGQGEIEQLVNGIDKVDPTEAAKRVLYTGSPAYRRAYYKFLTQSAAGPMFTAEEGFAFHEARTALVTASNTAVPFDLDPTMVINTSGAINPFRDAFRVVKTTSNDWRPSVSSGMTAVYEDEATAATDLSPSFTAPARLLVKAHTAATFSVEIEGDYALGSLEAEISKEISDAKDVLEATQFATGAGTTHFPNGIYNYFTANFLDTATTLVIVPSDIYKVLANLGPRYRADAVWLGSPYFYSLVRGIDTAGGAGLWVDNLTLGGSVGDTQNKGRLGNLVGKPAYEAIAPANSSMATTEKVAILCNKDRFVIIDRIGMNIELIPNFLDTTTGYPTGQRMVYAWWRNTSVGIGLATLGAGRAATIFRGK